MFGTLLGAEVVNSTKCHQNVISSIHRHPTLNTFLTASYDGYIKIWKHTSVKKRRVDAVEGIVRTYR